MAKSEEVNTDNKINPYLESPKAFHLEMPLYLELDLSDDLTVTKITQHLTYSDTIDAYCIYCNKEGVFKAGDYLNLIGLAAFKKVDGLTEIGYHCTRDDDHQYHIIYFKKGLLFTKIGQFPSIADFQIPQVEKYRKILGEEQYKELTRSIGLASHGVGIGSFVYLRRILENLIKEAGKQAQSDNEKIVYDDFRNERIGDKIKMVSNYLPEFLVDNSIIHTILSKGIHELSEDECLRYFEAVKLGIEQILDEKIIQDEKSKKNSKAKKALQVALGKITKS